MGCCNCKQNVWDMNFTETKLSSNRCDAEWESIKGEEATFGAEFPMPISYGLIFDVLPPVIRVKLGYAGGTAPNPTMEKLKNHILAVNVEYDSSEASFEMMLYIFFWMLQRSDVQESIIFYRSREQRAQIKYIVATEEREQLLNKLGILEQPFTSHIKTRPLDEDHEFIDCEDKYQHSTLQYEYRKLMKLLRKRLKPHQLAYSHLACRVEGYAFGLVPFDTPDQFDQALADLYLSKRVEKVVKKLANQAEKESEKAKLEQGKSKEEKNGIAVLREVISKIFVEKVVQYEYSSSSTTIYTGSSYS